MESAYSKAYWFVVENRIECEFDDDQFTSTTTSLVNGVTVLTVRYETLFLDTMTIGNKTFATGEDAQYMNALPSEEAWPALKQAMLFAMFG